MTTFALFYGNRAFMPDRVVDEARPLLEKAVTDAGFDFISIDPSLTSHGAAETATEGKIYAEFLAKNKGKYDGVIACLANFSDESATVAALKDCGTPILIQASPDTIGKMGFEWRRDAFCGKLAITDVFCQYGIPFSLTASHVVAPDSQEFHKELLKFGSVCRIVGGLRGLSVLAIGARTTAFKSMRFDELTAQQYGITVETVDLSDFFLRMKSVDPMTDIFRSKTEYYHGYADFSNVPAAAFDNMIRASVVADELTAMFGTDCLTIRCWDEFQREMNISVCNLISELNERGYVTACELDLANAISMKALSLASEHSSTCLDFNNNYGNDPEKCILFHCGPVANSLMASKGEIMEHKMFQKTMGSDFSWGVNQGRLSAMPITYASLKTENGRLLAYADNAEITDDVIEDEFFGTGGVARISNMNDKLYKIAKKGFRHHVSVTKGHCADAIKESYDTYLNINMLNL